MAHGAAAISYLPVLVEPHLLQRANSRLGAASSVADSAGSNMGAALIGSVGAARSVIADVLSYLVSALLVWRIRTPEPVATRPDGRRSLARDIREGLHYVLGQPTIRTVIAALSTLSFGLAIMNTYWAYYLLAVLNVSPTVFGVIMGIGGAGSLAGALLAPRIASRIGIGPTIIVGFAVSPVPRCHSCSPNRAFAGISPWPLRWPHSCSGRRRPGRVGGPSGRSFATPDSRAVCRPPAPR
ncbi:MFS transporter [Streptomyces sp. NPDC059835]|uniref:MFS transporter n=1 Tax=Streptomyces sp. NPDC059835 TaxID=3346967 RepID=UPI00364FD51C